MLIIIDILFFVLGYSVGRKNDIRDGYRLGYNDCKRDMEKGYVVEDIKKEKSERY